MHFIPYNSRKKYHLSPGAAVRSGEDMIFRIVLPRSEQCSAVRLILETDGGEREDFSFSWERMQGENEEWWRLETAAPESAGIVWYFFEYDTPWGTKKISLESNGNAVIGEGSRWRLTVCRENCDTPLWLRGGTMYQIFPDRFCRSGKTPLPENKPAAEYHSRWGEEPDWEPDSDGKIEKYDFFGGDLKGIEEKLGYLESFGVTCIYLNPIFSARSNHRYDTGDYMKIDPMLGTEEDFKSLCKSAEEHGIKILLDGVFSHTGSDSVYFNREGRYGVGGAYHDPNSRYRPWYDFGSQYPCGYRSWWGFDTLPEVREENPDYQDFICGEGGVIDTWMKLGASGFRLDVADELPDFFIERIRQAVKAHGADKLLLGEVWEDATTKEAYGVRRTYLLGKGLDSVMNYPFKEAVLNFLRGGDGQAAAQAILDICEHYPAPALHSLFNFMSTHDTVRAITALAGEPLDNHDRNWQSGRRMSPEAYEHGVKLLAMAYAAIFTLPGVPSIYYGDEVAMQGYKDPFNRGYYEWDSTETRLRPILTQLALLRKSCDAFKKGRFELVEAGPDLLHYRRVGPTQSAEIALNRSNALRVITAFGKAAEVNPMGFTILVEDNATARLQAGPAGPGGRTTLQYQKG